eukprot:scaffold7843_cov376-Prasinococcus_capsulatus_cf.AAC.3
MPNNGLMAKLMPQCDPMMTFEVRVFNDVVYVKKAKGDDADEEEKITYGGSNTSSEDTGGNVFSLEPKMYIDNVEEGVQGFEDANEKGIKGQMELDPNLLLTGVAAGSVVAVALTAYFVVNANYIGLGLFWALGFGAFAAFALKTTD